jgi:two-component system sensor histidine kinase VicK
MISTDSSQLSNFPFLQGGGQMGQLIRAYDWTNSPLGEPGSWPSSLKVMIAAVLVSPSPMHITWGPEYTLLYNDAYMPILGNIKHPSALGHSLEASYPEIWLTIQPKLQNAMNGEAIRLPDLHAFLNRNEQRESCYFDISYIPIRNENGIIEGVLTSLIETTERKNSESEKQKLAEELRAVNEELTSTNEEYLAANEDLESAQEALQLTFEQLEESEIALRLAIEAADFGTWHIHSVTRKFVTDARLRVLFGFLPEEEITIEQAVGQITDEFREYVSTALENAIYKGGNYDVSYPVIGFHDQQHRWLRAIGNLKGDPSGEFSSFTGVVMDISELKLDEQRKNDFIAMVSHELKTPLTSLTAYLQVLLMKTKKLEDQFISDALHKSVRQVKKMTSMINGFLDVTRLESGKITIDKQYFDIAQLILEAEDEASVMITTHQLIFHPVEHNLVWADRNKIGQVISNFITNAVKYSKADTPINISCVAKGNFVEVRVNDEGMGIKPEDLPHLFERFYRVENNNHISGFGIGLYLCSEIVKRHEGKIWADSKLNRGSSFYFTLPLAEYGEDL